MVHFTYETTFPLSVHTLPFSLLHEYNELEEQGIVHLDYKECERHTHIQRLNWDVELEQANAF